LISFKVTPGEPPRAAVPITRDANVTSLNSEHRQQRVVSFTYNYVLVASQPGDVTIPSISVAGRADADHGSASAKIVPAAAASCSRGHGDGLCVSPPRGSGRRFISGNRFRWKCISTSGRRINWHFPDLKTDGFSESVATTPDSSQVAGVGYNVFVFRISATAARTGKLDLRPFAGINLRFRRPASAGSSFRLRLRTASVTL
jgi:hypothetical protein